VSYRSIPVYFELTFHIYRNKSASSSSARETDLPTNVVGLSAAEIAREDFDYSNTMKLISDNDFNELSRLLGTNLALDDKHIPNLTCKPEVTKKGRTIHSP
jgi:hypothetical protein